MRFFVFDGTEVQIASGTEVVTLRVYKSVLKSLRRQRGLVSVIGSILGIGKRNKIL